MTGIGIDHPRRRASAQGADAGARRSTGFGRNFRLAAHAFPMEQDAVDERQVLRRASASEQIPRAEVCEEGDAAQAVKLSHPRRSHRNQRLQQESDAAIRCRLAECVIAGGQRQSAANGQFQISGVINR